MHATSQFLDLENCRVFGFSVAKCRVIVPSRSSRDLIYTDRDWFTTSTRRQVKKLEGEKKGEYHIYEQFKKKPKENRISTSRRNRRPFLLVFVCAQDPQWVTVPLRWFSEPDPVLAFELRGKICPTQQFAQELLCRDHFHHPRHRCRVPIPLARPISLLLFPSISRP